jgi:hypothetical protein
MKMSRTEISVVARWLPSALEISAVATVVRP